VHPGGATLGVVGVDCSVRPTIARGIAPADFDLVVDRGVALVLGVIRGVDHGAKGRGPVVGHRMDLSCESEGSRIAEARSRGLRPLRVLRQIVRCGEPRGCVADEAEECWHHAWIIAQIETFLPEKRDLSRAAM
jgi:hypothetical protein